MSNQYIGEIRIWACNFAPRDWAFCNGQVMGITQNTALFALIGTYYGGNGQTTFGLPDFRGRAPVEQGHGSGLTTRVIGEMGGEANETLLYSEMPNHTHSVFGAVSGQGGSGQERVAKPTSQAYLGVSGMAGNNLYSTGTANAQLAPSAIGPAGGSTAHNNMQPFLALNFCIATSGVFPPRN